MQEHLPVSQSRNVGTRKSIAKLQHKNGIVYFTGPSKLDISHIDLVDESYTVKNLWGLWESNYPASYSQSLVEIYFLEL